MLPGETVQRIARVWPLVTVLVVGVSLPATGQRQIDAEQMRARFEGEWRYDGTHEEGRRVIAGAIDRVVDDMIFFARGIARGRLREANRFSPTVRIRFPTDRISITFERRFTYVTPDDGRWTVVTDPAGDRVSCSQRMIGARIVQIFRNDEGSRTNAFWLVGDRRMRFGVTVQGDPLPSPVRYRLDYRRVSPGPRAR